MYMTLFGALFPEVATAEMRTITVLDFQDLPQDVYGILEAYCTDPECDCRRVTLNVVSKQETDRGERRYLATISYAVDRDDEFPGPDLDLLNEQSEYAEVLFDIISNMLENDREYVARLERHYNMVKLAARRGEIPPPPGGDKETTAATLRAIAESVAAKKAGRRAAPEARPAAPAEPERVPKAMRATYDATTAITDAFCREHLNEEYLQLSRKLAAALARKRPSPLSSGKPNVWACGIIYALGSANFLYDKSQSPHMRADELCRLFGVSKSTAGTRAKYIRDAVGMHLGAWRWALPGLVEQNSLYWMISVDGIIMDARTAPRAIQEEAARRGLIPYLPGTR